MTYYHDLVPVCCGRCCRASIHQRRAAGAGRVPGRLYTGLTREAYALDLRSSPPGASSLTCSCSKLGGLTLSALPATWKQEAGLGRR
jgi:hypothetical protein